ncbi:hypothetical protein ICE98_02981 [Lactococcus lactis]|nr:hypothetical protein [Lactococcus lactis]
MTVESLLKVIEEGMTVNVKDCYGNMIILLNLEMISKYFLQVSFSIKSKKLKLKINSI